FLALLRAPSATLTRIQCSKPFTAATSKEPCHDRNRSHADRPPAARHAAAAHRAPGALPQRQRGRQGGDGGPGFVFPAGRTLGVYPRAAPTMLARTISPRRTVVAGAGAPPAAGRTCSDRWEKVHAVEATATHRCSASSITTPFPCLPPPACARCRRAP